MKVKYKHIDRKEIAKLTKSYYEVLGFGYYANELKPILILNDDLEFCSMANDAVEKIDESKEGYVQINKMCYGNEFYLSKELAVFCSNFNHIRICNLIISGIGQKS